MPVIYLSSNYFMVPAWNCVLVIIPFRPIHDRLDTNIMQQAASMGITMASH